ncbi:MAG: DUF58 domain-containing protein [Chloroflexi bacterium]|nr:DUF58 domain-containing protein [Chloroflexota bacterium]
MTPNGRKAIVVIFIVLAAGLISGFPLLSQLFYVLAGTLAVSFVWSRANTRGLKFTRNTLNHRSQVGDVAEEEFFVENTSFLPKIWLAVRDHSTLAGHNASRALLLRGKAKTSWRVKTLCRLRGKFWLGPATVSSGDPFGLFVATRPIADRRPLIVYPATVDLPDFDIPVGDLQGGPRMTHRAHFFTPSVQGIREYVPGDAFNRIHWLSTARNRRLMVKEFQMDPSSDVWVFLDMEREPQAGLGQESTEEYGVTIAASISRHFLSANRSVGLVAYGAHHAVIHSDRGLRQLTKILEELAVMKADGRVSLAEVLFAEGSRFGRNTTLVVVTPSLDESWPRALRDIMLRGVRVVAVALEANTFAPGESSVLLLSSLAEADIPTYWVKRGDALDRALSGQRNGVRRQWHG